MPPVDLGYALHPLPPGRLGRRWRWELWDGALLVAAGWRLSLRQAEAALRTAAARRAHARAGLVALRPERTPARGGLAAGATVRVEQGPVSWRLVPRDLAAERAA